MTPYLRLALRAGVLALFVLGSSLAAGSAGVITREQFIRAYVLCNNGAWAGSSHELIPFARSEQSRRDAGTRSPAVAGFIGLGYLGGDKQLLRAREPATLGWAAATKAYADDGGIEPQFRRPEVARAYVKGEGARDVQMLTAREIGALATNLHVARLAKAPREWVLAGMSGRSVTTPLDETAAVTMLRAIGSHEAAGSARTAPLVIRQCRARDVRTFLEQRS